MCMDEELQRRASIPPATGADIQFIRAYYGLSQDELATLLGVGKGTVARWEQGAMDIGHPRLLALALRCLVGEEILRDNPNLFGGDN